MGEKVIFIGPKYETFGTKSEEEKEVVLKSIRDEYSKIPDGVTVRYLYEDFVMGIALKGFENVKCMSVLNKTDRAVLLDSYARLDESSYESDDGIIELNRKRYQEVFKKYKPPKSWDYPTEWEYLEAKCGIAMKRLRALSTELLESSEYKGIFFFDNGCNFCTLPLTEVGCGKLIVDVCVSLKRNRMTNCSFGGVPVPQEFIWSIVKGFV